VIRRAAFADIPAFVSLLADQHAGSIYADTAALDTGHAKTLLLQAIQADGRPGLGGTLVRAAEHGGRVTGLFVGILERVYDLFTPDTLRARDLLFVHDPAGDPRDPGRLLDAFLAWADAHPGVIEMQASMTRATGQPDRVARLYARRGFTQHGLIYRRSKA
jgi:hypothetical protein